MKALVEHEELLSGAQLARKLDLDPATIRRWRREHAPCHYMGNNLIRYKLSEIIKWRETRPKNPPQEKGPEPENFRQIRLKGSLQS
jgi:hypothetical protein